MRIGRNETQLRCVSNYRVRKSSVSNNLKSTASAKIRRSSSSSKTSTAVKTTGTLDTSVYSGIKNSAASVRTHANKLASTDEKSIFANAEKNEDTSTIVKEVKTFVRDYNSMISNMKTTGSTVNNYFARELNTYATQNKTGLEAVGIKIEDNGTLTINEKTLEKATIGDLKKVFNGDESFAGKTAEKCSSIETKAASDYNAKLYSNSSSNYRFSYRT